MEDASAKAIRAQFQHATGAECAAAEIEAAALIAHAEREIADFDTLIACATGSGSAREVLIRERRNWIQERDRAAQVLAILGEIV